MNLSEEMALTDRKRSKKPKQQAAQERQLQQEEPTVSPEEKLGLRFRDHEAFGNFCVTLASDRVPFELAGFQTVILTQMQLYQLPYASAHFYQACKQDQQIEEVALVSMTGHRYLPTREETERLLHELAEKY